MTEHDQIQLQIAVTYWRILRAAWLGLEDALAETRKPHGTHARYLALIPPKALTNDPWTVDAPAEAMPFFVAAIAIGQLMAERLSDFAEESGLAQGARRCARFAP